MQIVIGVCRERVAYWEHTDSVEAAERFVIQRGAATGKIVDSPTYIHLGRERIVNIFLEQTRASHLCFVDSDNTLPPEAFWALAQRDLPIVGATYFGRRKFFPPDVIAKKWVDGGPYSRSINKKLRETVLEYDLPIKPQPQYIESAPLLTVDVIGFGCLMIQREVLETLSEKYTHIFGGHGEIGEDACFCMHAQNEGYKIYLDLGVQLGHLRIDEVTIANFMAIQEWVET